MPKRQATELLEFDMNGAHNMFKTGLDNMLKHLEHPPLDDLPNFLGYCSIWAKLLHHHHDFEGTSFLSSLPSLCMLTGYIWCRAFDLPVVKHEDGLWEGGRGP